jgi:two-component system, NarL family, response regulator NreC
MTIRVVIAEDHAIVREGVRLILDREGDIEVVGEATDGLEAVRLAGEVRPDVVCMDLNMPGIDGMEATRRIRRAWPEVTVVALTVHDSDEYFFEMMRAGASGYVLKGAASGDLVDAVRTAAGGGAFLYPALARKLVDDYVARAREDESADAVGGLTPREREILTLVGDGRSNKAIGEQLVISLSTVQTHYANILAKLGLTNRTELVKYAIRHGLIAME